MIVHNPYNLTPPPPPESPLEAVADAVGDVVDEVQEIVRSEWWKQVEPRLWPVLIILTVLFTRYC